MLISAERKIFKMAGFLSRLKNKRPAIYTDFDASFEPHPLTNDIQMLSDEKAIAQSLKFLILTNLGERLFQPTVGGDIANSMFRLITPATILILKERVRELIQNYEGRVSIVDIDVIAIDDQVKIDVYYTLQNREDTITATIFLERNR